MEIEAAWPNLHVMYLHTQRNRSIFSHFSFSIYVLIVPYLFYFLRSPNFPMGRQKQATPLRREVSSEYTSAADRTPRHLARGTDEMGKNVTLNGHANGKAISGAALAEKKQAGLPQLIVAVGGIYVSL
jgi:hypothetical protein